MITIDRVIGPRSELLRRRQDGNVCVEEAVMNALEIERRFLVEGKTAGRSHLWQQQSAGLLVSSEQGFPSGEAS